ncbi:MAG: GNAT family N-acetyltransferase [Pseudomonadota bacterium]
MTAVITLQHAKPDDWETVLGIWREAARAAHPFVPGEGRGARAHAVRADLLPRAETMLAKVDDRAVGVLCLLAKREQIAEIAKLYVLPSSQKQGIGRALLNWASTQAPTLTAPVFLRNTAGLGFWHAMGFSEAERAIDAATAEVVVIMERQT